jgi:iron complex outermembrane receptor protein
MSRLSNAFAQARCWLAAMSLVTLVPTLAVAQTTGTIEGRVTNADGSPLSGVIVSVEGTGLSAVTGTDGRYRLARVPSGERAILLRRLGQRSESRTATVQAGATLTLDVTLGDAPITLGGVVVSTASRLPERVVEAPAAVTLVDPVEARDVSATGQTARVVAKVPGVDLVQSDVNDFNLNARGFNTTLNRRVLVLQDGRDLAVAFLGAQEWSTVTMPTEDFGRVEMVRGPGSALYGANAFSGVLNIITPPARDVVGTRITLAGGELSTLKADLRHAGLFADGRLGYRLNAGYMRSGTWSTARTRFDGSDLAREYTPATDSAVGSLTEVIPLNGQTIDPVSGEAVGDPAALTSLYGTGRLDYYFDNGSVFTAEGGMSQSKNMTIVTGLGRVQIQESLRPWARLNWAANHFNVMTWYSGRTSPGPQLTLNSGINFKETSSIWHAEAQYNRAFADDKARVVLGGSFRNYQVDTEGTLMNLANDGRSDNYYSAYGQVEVRPVRQLRAVVAARWDEGDLIQSQISPKAALVFAPNDDHAIRLTFSRAFQIPNYSEYFLQAPAGAPSTSAAAIERGAEGYFQTLNNHPLLGPAFAALNLPNDLPWNFSDTTLVLALGNGDLEVETVRGWEWGYKGTFDDRVFVSFDLFFSELKNFVTDLLPGVNPAYPSYSLGEGGTDVLADLNAAEAQINALEAGLIIDPATAAALRQPINTIRVGYNALVGQAGTVLATLPNGERAIVVSYGNAGRVIEYGAEIGVGAKITNELQVDGSFAFIEVKVREFQQGDELIPNTPKYKGHFGVSYRGRQGIDVSTTARYSSGHRWLAGVFDGWVPSRLSIDVSASYAINNMLRVFATGTNILDQQRFHLYGGSVVGRRIVGGVTATF